MIEQFTAGMDFASFRANPMAVAAVERKLQIISEAAVRLKGDAERLFPYQPWRDIRGIGNHLRHTYDRIALDTIWGTVKDDLPRLRESIVRNPAAPYTIEVRTGRAPDIKCRVVGQFSDETMGILFDELQISDEDWARWHDEVQRKQEAIPVTPEFPELSRLAWTDEGTVHFTASKLFDDCDQVASSVRSDATRALVAALQDAAQIAMREQEAQLVVHPFGP